MKNESLRMKEELKIKNEETMVIKSEQKEAEESNKKTIKIIKKEEEDYIKPFFKSEVNAIVNTTNKKIFG